MASEFFPLNNLLFIGLSVICLIAITEQLIHHNQQHYILILSLYRLGVIIKISIMCCVLELLPPAAAAAAVTWTWTWGKGHPGILFFGGVYVLHYIESEGWLLETNASLVWPQCVHDRPSLGRVNQCLKKHSCLFFFF